LEEASELKESMLVAVTAATTATTHKNADPGLTWLLRRRQMCQSFISRRDTCIGFADGSQFMVRVKLSRPIVGRKDTTTVTMERAMVTDTGSV
jgi:hypothetical protein